MKRSTLLEIATCAVILTTVLAQTGFAQQDKSKRPSPPGTATFKFDDGKTITVNYSRPKVNDPKSGQPRKIYGGLVPYGEPWRAGANEATSFVTAANLTIGSTSVPAGSYTLYIQPVENGPWKLIISKKTGQWGIPYPGEADDLARVPMKVEKLSEPVDPFTITLSQAGGAGSGQMCMAWETTKACADLKAK